MKKVIVLIWGLIFCFSFTSANAQSTITTDMPVSLSVSQTTVNRFIATQWSAGNYNWEGFDYGVGYNIQLNEPSITLLENRIQINLSLTIMSSVYSGTVSIGPELDIPDISTSTTEIRAEYMNLRKT